MSILARVVYRFAATKQETAFLALLEKVRKGADSSLKIPQLLQILDYLGGWTYKVVDGLKAPWITKPKIVSTDTLTEAEVTERYQGRLRLETGPKQLGKFYPFDLTEPKILPGGSFGFTYKEYILTNGILFRSPEGKEYEAFNQNAQGEPLQGVVWEPKLKEWLRKETKFLDQISQVLGVATPSESGVTPTSTGLSQSKVRDLSGTGTCPACFRNIKLKKNGDQYKMVLHGYERPGWGYTEGRCIGVDHPPFEESPKGTKEVVKVLTDRVRGLQRYLKDLEAGKFDAISTRGNAIVRKGDPSWTKEFIAKVAEVEYDIKQLDADIHSFEQLIQKWTKADLPKVGDKVAPPPRFLTL